MPKYVSVAGLIARHGTEYVASGVVGNTPGEGEDFDAQAVEWAIRDAEAKVDSYLDRRYVLPLPGVDDREDPESNPAVPDKLRTLVADIAFYRLAPEHDLLTNEKRERYKDAIKELEAFETTGRGLGLEGKETPKGSVEVYSRPRVFARDDAGGLP